MSTPSTQEECEAKGWFWNAKASKCEKPEIGSIKMTLTRGPNCDGNDNDAEIPDPEELSRKCYDALLELSRKTDEE